MFSPKLFSDLLKARFFLALVLGASLVAFAVGTVRWPLVGDATLMHYVVFLTRNGFTPYKDIVDMNMPGTYITEAFAMSFLGPGAIGWRIFDFSLMATAAAAMVYIALPYGWLGGLFGGVLFLLIHGHDGIPHSGQRDFTVAALLLVATALLLFADRRNTTRPLLLFGFCAGMAITLKPTAAPASLILLIVGASHRKYQEKSPLNFLGLSLLGFVVPFFISCIYLWHYHAFDSFVWTLFHLIPYDASLGRKSIGYLLQHCLSPIQPLFAVALILMIVTWRSQSWENWLLTGAAVCGLSSYILQGKGYPYHRYPFLAFVLLIAGIQFTMALKRSRIEQWVGLISLVYGTLVFGAFMTVKTLRYDGDHDEFERLLKTDLNALGGEALSHNVQCIDMSAGCIKTLYNMRLVQSTGFLYEYYLLPREDNPVSDVEREQFLHEIESKPPKVFIVTDQDYLVSNAGFNKIKRWPALEQYLESNYSVVDEKNPKSLVKWEPRNTPEYGYRIYQRKSR